MHACGLTFSDGTLYVGAITIYATNSNTSITPPTTPIVPPSNGGTDVKPPVNVNANPTVKEQILNYDKSKSENVVIKDVNYDGTQLEFIYIGSNLVDAKNLVLTNDTITIPANILSNKLVLSPEVLEYIGFDSSTYNIQAVLEDGNVVSKKISLNITKSWSNFSRTIITI